MAALDSINGKWGRGTLRTGSVPMRGARRKRKNRTVSTSDMGQALVQPGLCPIEVHLNP
ncbi:DUF4113 domain-containing protein, partial [Pseudomonas syringae group genomosp. 3]|uniref:DUF4113 domain-containing protein n=2 Tax=Pseudomonas TaxID=286 RepID=UPI000F008326